MQVWIGTSGYSYPDWVGPFYPPGTPARRMLPYYCRQFPLVELNFTFYRPPTAAMLARLADQVPAGFQFVVKMPRTISHEQRPDDLASFHLAVRELKQRGQLLGILCQLPQAQHSDRPNRAWLERLAEVYHGLDLAVEFRHHSWHRKTLPAWMGKHGLDLVSVDVPDLAGLFPRGLVQSGPRVYVRFHSRNAAKWYASDKERYDYHYDDAALTEWVEAIQKTAPETERVLLLFNNCFGGQAVDNARRIAELLARLAPGLEVVPTPASTSAAEQKSLFDGLE